MYQKIFKPFFFSLFFILTTYTASFSATYYVSSSGGSDGASGTSESQAWKTISKVNGTSFSAGDVIRFKRNETWHESLVIPSSGSSSNPIVFGAYGSGNRPMITGADNISSWTRLSTSNVYRASCSWTPRMVFSDDVELTKRSWPGSESQAQSTLNSGEWTLDDANNRLYIYVPGGDTNPSSHVIAASRRDTNINGNGKSYIRIENIETRYANGMDNNASGGVYTGTGSNWTLSDVVAHHNHSYGVVVSSSNTEVLNCVMDRNYIGLRIYKWSTIYNVTIDGCQLFQNDRELTYAGDAIRVGNVDGYVIQNCRIFNHNGGTCGDGIQAQKGARNGHIRYNFIKETENASIIVSDECGKTDIYYNVCVSESTVSTTSMFAFRGQVETVNVYNNLFYENVRSHTYTIYLDYSHQNGINFKNNIVVSKKSGASGVCIRKDTTASDSHITMDNNLYYSTESQPFQWNGSRYSSLSQYQNAVSKDLHSLFGDPQFVNESSLNFNLSENSPAINKGVNFNQARDFNGNPINGTPDIGPFEYQGGSVQPPSIQSVTINPSSGWAGIGDTVTVTVRAANNEAGLTPSKATVNTRQITLNGQGDGTYTGTYTVQSGDPDASNVNATGITLTGAGGTSSTASSSGSTLKVDAHRPVVADVTLNPSSGWLKAGSTVTITATASNAETGLTSSSATINGKQVALAESGGGVYTGTYTVSSSDAQGQNLIAMGVTLTDAAGNTSGTASSSESTLKVDTVAPAVSSVALNPNTGTVNEGAPITITATASNNEAGLNASAASFNGRSVPLTDKGNGTYAGTYTIQAGDTESSNVNATGITLTDAAGNISPAASSSGSTLHVEPNPAVPAPSIASVEISPSSGWAGIGDTVAITVRATNNESGLSASQATINNRSVTLADQGNGTYTGTYIVQSGDPNASNVNATGITLTGEGGTSAAASSSGSTLKIDGHRPSIENVTLSPSSGWLKNGDDVIITVSAGNDEAGLTSSKASINGKTITLSDEGSGNYSGTYTVSTGDTQGENIAATGITLTDEAGNTSVLATSGASALTVDTIAPVISSVTIIPNSGTVIPGNEVVIVATAANGETGLTASPATINNRTVTLTGQGNGTYRGVYTVSGNDPDGMNVEAENITLTDPAGNTSTKASSSGSTLTIDTTPIQPPPSAPVVASVQISPSSGRAGIGDEIEIIAQAANSESGLVASVATINSRQVQLYDQTDGTYTGTYTVQEGDPNGINVEATGITLTGEGGTSATASSSGSTLIVDSNRPVVQSVSLTPSSGWLKAGDAVTITATAANNEEGLTVSSAGINGIQIPMTEQGGGFYSGQYTVSANDTQGTGLAATGIVFTDDAGNASTPGSSTKSTLRVDTHAPTIQTVTISPSTGTVRIGGTVTVTVRAGSSEVGLFASPAMFNGRHVELTGRGDGTYQGTYTVLNGDGAVSNVEAVNVTLTDEAGNVSTPVSSSGSTLTIDPTPVTDPVDPPVIASVEITPSNGLIGIGEDVTITAHAENNLTGLSASPATFNSRQVNLTDRGDGSYTGTYTVKEGDPDVVNAEATGITLTGEGGTSATASSKNSRLSIDAHTPVISSVTLSPSQGWLGIGDDVNVIVRTDPSETGLTPSQAMINGYALSLQDAGDGTYRGTYTVQAGHNQGLNLKASSITLSDMAGNTSSSASSTITSLSIDTVAPVITSVTVSPDQGQVVAGDKVTVRVFTDPIETGLNGTVDINGHTLVLEDRYDGTYRGIYTVAANDNPANNIQARNALLIDPAGNTSSSVSSSITSLSIIPGGSNGEQPKIASVEISPKRGWVTTGSTVQITVKAETPEEGMSASPATINGETVALEPLVIQSDAYHVTEVPGTFVGRYIVGADDEQGKNIEAENIILTNASGVKSLPASSSGSTLKVDTVKPTISNVKLLPVVSKSVNSGDAILVSVTAENNETGLIPSDAIIGDTSVPLADRGDGTYSGMYTVTIVPDMDYLIEARNITLTDPAGNVSDPASSTGSDVVIDVPVTVDRVDFNEDGIVNLGDLTTMGRSWSKSRDSENYNGRLDLNQDGIIGLGDLVLLARYWGHSSAALAKLAKTAPVETGDVVLSASITEISSQKYAIIFTCSETDIEGISITLGLPASSIVDIKNIEGLSEINITREVEPGVFELNAYYAEGRFPGTITVPVTVDSPDNESISVISALVAESGGNMYEPMLSGSLPEIMLVPSENEPLLVRAGETWVDVNVKSSEERTYGLILQPLNGTGDARNMSLTDDKLRIKALKPGQSYKVILTDAQGVEIFSKPVTTLAAFVDDDLDPEDPFILRDENGLFIADNDDEINFSWTSWKPAGAQIYEVTVNGGETKNVLLVDGTSVSIKGENGTYFSVTIIPRDSQGKALGRIDSRAILCPVKNVGNIEDIVIN